MLISSASRCSPVPLTTSLDRKAIRSLTVPQAQSPEPLLYYPTTDELFKMGL